MPDVTAAGHPLSIEQLLDGATSRRDYKTADSLSGSHLEQVEFGERRFVLKVLNPEDDWLMRAIGDDGSRQAVLFRSRVLEDLPPCIDHTVTGVATEPGPGGTTITALLMHDIAGHLIPPGGDPVALETHRRLLVSMASMHAAFWGWDDSLGLMPIEAHYTFLAPTMAQSEIQRGHPAAVPLAVARGWQRLLEVSPAMGRLAATLTSDPTPLVSALRATPQTLVHGDWKFGNLGEHPDGRTILLDWDRAGSAPAALDLAWYLAVNCDRLPESKEATIAAYVDALRERGIETTGWWERQLALALLGAFVQLGWSKADGDAAELRWWEDRAAEGKRAMG